MHERDWLETLLGVIEALRQLVQDLDRLSQNSDRCLWELGRTVRAVEAAGWYFRAAWIGVRAAWHRWAAAVTVRPRGNPKGHAGGSKKSRRKRRRRKG